MIKTTATALLFSLAACIATPDDTAPPDGRTSTPPVAPANTGPDPSKVVATMLDVCQQLAYATCLGSDGDDECFGGQVDGTCVEPFMESCCADHQCEYDHLVNADDVVAWREHWRLCFVASDAMTCGDRARMRPPAACGLP